MFAPLSASLSPISFQPFPRCCFLVFVFPPLSRLDPPPLFHLERRLGRPPFDSNMPPLSLRTSPPLPPPTTEKTEFFGTFRGLCYFILKFLIGRFLHKKCPPFIPFLLPFQRYPVGSKPLPRRGRRAPSSGRPPQDFPRFLFFPHLRTRALPPCFFRCSVMTPSYSLIFPL